MICVTRVRFKKHVSTHVETSPKAWPICDKTFSFPSQLKRHMEKKDCSKSKKTLDHELTFDTATTTIPMVVESEKSDNDNDESDKENEEDKDGDDKKEEAKS